MDLLPHSVEFWLSNSPFRNPVELRNIKILISDQAIRKLSDIYMVSSYDPSSPSADWPYVNISLILSWREMELFLIWCSSIAVAYGLTFKFIYYSACTTGWLLFLNYSSTYVSFMLLLYEVITLLYSFRASWLRLLSLSYFWKFAVWADGPDYYVTWYIGYSSGYK